MDEDYPKVADYFVVAGLTDTSRPLDEELAFPDFNHKLNPQPKDPITDICIIDRTLEEKCPQGFTCIDKTPSGLMADLNHGSFTAHNIFLCYRRGRDKPPLVDLGVYYEGLENVRNGISIVETTPTGRSANVNNKSGMGSFPIYLTYRRAEESAPQSTLVVTDICIILTNKNEYPPYAYCLIDKNLNKGMIGSSVYLCYKKSMRQVNSVAFKAGILGRYPLDDTGSFPLPATVPLFCLPMGATIECWSSKTKHPLPSFSTFVLTTETSEKVYGAVVSFYESYPEDRLLEEHKFKLGLLRGDGHKARGEKTIHTNKAICMLSKWPLFDAFRDFLIYLYRLTVSPIAHAVPVERHIAHFMHNVPFPSPQRPRVQYQMSPMHATILTRPQMTPIPLSGASFLALIDDLGAENTLTLITLALTEHKIVIHSLRRAEITRVAEALITLLFPFKWQCTYVPLCPLEMAYVLEAPCPFIVGVDSRYFDLYEPPHDVACVNLDTNNITLIGEKKITWKVLPKKPAKQARTVLQNLFTEIKQSCPRMKDDEGEYMSTVFDPDQMRTRRHMQIELIIQETLLKFMAIIMHGYRDYLLPITEAPGAGTTDPASLFSIQEFIRSRDRASQRFFTMLTGTQLFAAFVEARSFASFSGPSGEGAGKATSLVFFDECIDRLESEHPDHVRLIEADDTLKSEHTVFIMPPEEKGLPTDIGYQYTTFPDLQEELFALDDDNDIPDNKDTPSRSTSSDKQRRKSGTFVIGRRTKQETRVTQKQAKLYSKDPQMWSRILLSSIYSVWFGCLPEFARQCRSKAAVLRAGHDALYALKEKGCIPLPDETCYRVLMHLCYAYNKPVLAVRVFHFVRDSGMQLSAITYGLYNKAVLESTWPASNRDGYMLWQKLRNVFHATVYLRQTIRHFNNNSAVSMSDNSSDIDSLGRHSLENGAQPDTKQKQFGKKTDRATHETPTLDASDEANNRLLSLPAEDSISAGGQSDHGYNSMPKDLVHRGSPPQPKSKDVPYSDDQTETKSTETTDSLISSISEEAPDFHPGAIPPLLERTLSGRIIQPPTTLQLSGVNTPGADGDNESAKPSTKNVDPGLQSDDTIVNLMHEGDNVESKNLLDLSPSADFAFHPSKPSPTGSASSRDRSGSILRTPGSTGSPGESVMHASCPDADVVDIIFPFPSETSRTNDLSNGVNICDDVAFTVIKTSDNGVTPACSNNTVTASLATKVSSLATCGTLPHMHSSPACLVNYAKDNEFLLATSEQSKSASDAQVPITPLVSPTLDDVEDDSVFDVKNFKLDEIETKPRAISAPLHSPGTPEMMAFFGDDSKFLSGLSDSDRRRHQELCGKRPSSLDQEAKLRSLSLLSPHTQSVPGISPLVGQKSFLELTHGRGSSGSPMADVPASRNNFDNLTADDIASPSSPAKTRSIFSSGGSISSRSRSASKLARIPHSPSPLTDLDSPATSTPNTPARAPTLRGSNSLTVVDGVAMLTSTPMRPLVPDDVENGSDKKDEVGTTQPATTDPLSAMLQDEATNASSPTSANKKQVIERQDITDLALDPLSPLSKQEISFPSEKSENNEKDAKMKSNSGNRHLVDEINQYMSRDSVTNDQSFDRSQSVMDIKNEKDQSNGHAELKRQSSLPGASPETPRKHPPPGLLSRSLTFAQGSSLSNSLMSSGSKLNSLLKATTTSMASKAKKLASNLAKDINETVQTNLAYYTPEKFKGSLSELTEDRANDGSSSARSYLGGSKADLYSSQSSLRSSESIHSSADATSTNDVRRRGGAKKEAKQNSRPLSMPPFGATQNDARLPFLGVPGSNSNTSELHLATSMNSLNIKGTADMDVTISSCSKCHRCECLVYDEEIMAGWMADESNLNTHCPFCNSLFVPFLNIEIKDYRTKKKIIQGTGAAQTSQEPSGSEEDPPSTFSQSFNLPLTPGEDSVLSETNDNETNKKESSERLSESSETGSGYKNPTLVITPPPSPAVGHDTPSTSSTTKVQSPTDDQPSSKKPSSSAISSPTQSSIAEVEDNGDNFTAIEPITVPYLSPLVLRKELESLLENEGTRVLGDAEFVDQHPIIYWNLIWYFRRLNLHSNLYKLVLSSKLVESRLDHVHLEKGKGDVAIHVMWDNVKLHENMAKPALYHAYHQLSSQSTITGYQPYSLSFLDNIKQSIIGDDVRGPLVALLSEFSAHSSGPNKFGRRSAYREILYLVIVALGKESIDVDAFDRVYKGAYEALTVQELSLARKCDKPLCTHAVECRNIFGQLDLY